MRRILWTAIAALTLLPALSPSPGPGGSRGLGAQEPGAAAFLFGYRPHDGRRRAFEDGYRRHLRWHRQRGDTLAWFGWDVLAGPGLGAFVDGTFGVSFGAFDVRVDPAGDGRDAAANVTAHADPLFRQLLRLRPELGTATPLETGSPTPLVEAVRVRVSPGGSRGVETALRALRREREEARFRPYTVYEHVAGTGAPGFLILVWRERWAGFDDPHASPVRALARRLSPRDAPDLEMVSQIWRYRPGLTYVPEARREP